MMRHFHSVNEFTLCQKASMTVRVIDVEPAMQFYAKKNSKTGLIESIPYFKGVLQDATSSIRCTWWSMADQHVAIQGLIGKCVTASGVQITISHARFADLNRCSVSFDGVRGSEMKVIADVVSIPTIMVTPGVTPLLVIHGPMLEMHASQSLSPSLSPFKRTSTEQACCDRPDMPFCVRRPGVRHVPKCHLCGSAVNDALNPICGMTGAPHVTPGATVLPNSPGKPELARRLMWEEPDTDQEEDSEKMEK